MGNPQYFSKFTGLLFAKGMENARPRRSSPFRLESLEARVLLSADLGGAMSVADILNSSTFGQQTVAQNTQPVQVQAISYSIPSPTPALSPATSQSTGNVFYVSPGGSDSNAGSSGSPWHSIHAAAQK